jgi:drug/metabolite transporter (DMT)-like permease
MNLQNARLRLKTRIFTTLAVASSVCGNTSLSWGLRRLSHALSSSPLAYIQALFNPWVALGASLLIVWLLSYMTLLSWAELSYVLPVTSVGYVFTALMGRLLLHEDISYWRWGGILCIVMGVVLVARTASHKSGVAL